MENIPFSTNLIFIIHFIYHFRCPDLPHADISQFFDECVEFIDRALSFSCGLVFVNCLLGFSRSTAIVSAYLMKKKGKFLYFWSISVCIGLFEIEILSEIVIHKSYIIFHRFVSIRVTSVDAPGTWSQTKCWFLVSNWKIRRWAS